jgi:hypothetical protein
MDTRILKSIREKMGSKLVLISTLLVVDLTRTALDPDRPDLVSEAPGNEVARYSTVCKERIYTHYKA